MQGTQLCNQNMGRSTEFSTSKMNYNYMLLVRRNRVMTGQDSVTCSSGNYSWDLSIVCICGCLMNHYGSHKLQANDANHKLGDTVCLHNNPSPCYTIHTSPVQRRPVNWEIKVQA